MRFEGYLYILCPAVVIEAADELLALIIGQYVYAKVLAWESDMWFASVEPPKFKPIPLVPHKAVAEVSKIGNL